MKKLFLKIGLGALRKFIARKAGDKKFRKRVIDLLNDKVDMPKLNEDQERRILSNLYDTIMVIVELM